MSFGEKIYLAGVLVAFASFIVMVGTLSWLDGRDARLRRRRQKMLSASHKAGTFIAAGAAHRSA